jgi:hypothetical protein
MAGSKVSSKVRSNVSDMAAASGHVRARALFERKVSSKFSSKFSSKVSARALLERH